MGVGALFLAMEAREELKPATDEFDPSGHTENAIALVWPIICFVVMGSTFVHGLSTVVITLSGSMSRNKGERAPLLGQETDNLDAMEHEEGDGESEPEVSGTDDDEN